MGKQQKDNDLKGNKSSNTKYFNVKFKKETLDQLTDEWKEVNCDEDGRLMEDKESRGAFFGRVFDDAITGLGRISIENQELKREIEDLKQTKSTPKPNKKMSYALITAIVLCIVLFAWGLYNRNQLKDFV